MDSETVEEITRRVGVVVEGLRSDVRVIAEGQTLLRQELTTRIGTLDRKIDVLDGKVGVLDRKVGVLDAKFDALERRVDSHDRRFDTMDKRFDSLERKVDGVTQIVQLTYSEVTGRLNDHETRLTVLERRQP